VKKSHLIAILLAAGISLVTSGASNAGCAVPGNASELAAQAGRLLNGERAKSGRKSLGVDSRLAAAAQAHACDMAVKGYFSHRGQNGSKPKRRLQQQGCRGGLVAENIAVGQTDPRELVRDWMASPGHRKNMLLGRGVERYGLGVAKAGRAYSHGYMWVLVISRGC